MDGCGGDEGVDTQSTMNGYRIASAGTASENDMPAMEGITTLSENDIILGRGGINHKHLGNAAFRSLVARNSELYATCQKTEKLTVSKSIVSALRETMRQSRWKCLAQRR